jgi:ABC-type transport system involved in multi-copper enzyme maturation permease subunit
MREVTGLILNRDQIPDKWLAPPRRTHLLADGKNPVLDKELRNELVGQGTLMLRMILQLGFGLMLVFTFAYMLGRPAHLFAYLASFTLLITPAFTAGLFTSEHENETFSLLATTLVTPREIVMGKVYVGLRLSLVLLALLILPTMPALVFSQLQSQIISVPALLALIATCVLWATALVAISLAWSASSRRTTAALIGSYLTGAAILVGPLLVQTVVVNFTSLPEAWANAGLTLSPLSHLYALGLPQGTRDVPTFAILGSEWTRWSLCAALLAILSVGLPLLIMARLERTWRRRAFD